VVEGKALSHGGYGEKEKRGTQGNPDGEEPSSSTELYIKMDSGNRRYKKGHTEHKEREGKKGRIHFRSSFLVAMSGGGVVR